MVGWNYRTWAQSKCRGDTLNVITVHWLCLLQQHMLLKRNDRLSKMSHDFKRRPENAEWVYFDQKHFPALFSDCEWVTRQGKDIVMWRCESDLTERTGFWGQYNWTSLALNGMLVAICGGEHRQCLYYQIIICQCHFDRLGCKYFAMIYFKPSLFSRKIFSVYKT